ncbi:MAG: sugar phosphate isomerase/epimerase [Bacteroidales bacterium]|nr:sugar phosphate isomerase/epimerase [Bacteroidales bacterium]
MTNITRRNFIEKSMVMGAAGIAAPSLLKATAMEPTPKPIKDDISLAQWALVEEVNAGKWKTLDFPKVAKTDFGLNGIEFVNTLFEVTTEGYLRQLKKNAADNGVTMVLIMVDDEGDGCSPTKEARRQFEINHRKWIDAAAYLGCHAIRTNCRGTQGVSKEEALKYAIETYQMMMEYAVPAKISVLIENHGGVSNDADWMVSLFKEVNNLYFGSYPDWRQPSDNFDNVNYLLKMLPYAGGMSYRNQPNEELTAKMIRLAKDSGYRGWYGIESSGRDEIKKGIALLKKYLF